MLEEGRFAIYEVKERFRPIKCKTADDAMFVFIACSFFYFIQNPMSCQILTGKPLTGLKSRHADTFVVIITIPTNLAVMSSVWSDII